ncbi:hypothetical protein LMG32289_03850 [Cupriavidus pampae]|uniref:Uncharacterized protein n=2 Tax=Cupriavidus pampae TaxID=659251 RepID=A0ABM8XBY5_9BURK|nr:hypothetical protein LMG32289_03850 [Cupriavidus pampae]
MANVGIWLFNLTQCGYYASRAPRRGTPPALSSIGSALSDLSRWSNGRRLTETCPYDLTDGSDIPLSYLLACEPEAGGDYLIGIWNRVNGDSNRIASIGHDDIVGAARTEYTDVDEARIPGFATYFWVMPAEAKVAAVRVKHRTNGVRTLEHYLRNFLKFVNPQHTVHRDDEERGLVVVGYRDNPEAEIVRQLFAKFALGTIRKVGDLDFIRARCNDIRAIVSKTTITSREDVDQDFWQTLSRRVGFGGRAMLEEVPLKLQLPMTFTEAELNNTLADWEAKEEQKLSDWDDLGFVFTGESSPRWLSKSHARNNFDVDVQWIDEEQVNPRALLQQLRRYRNDVLALG